MRLLSLAKQLTIASFQQTTGFISSTPKINESKINGGKLDIKLIVFYSEEKRFARADKAWLCPRIMCLVLGSVRVSGARGDNKKDNERGRGLGSLPHLMYCEAASWRGLFLQLISSTLPPTLLSVCILNTSLHIYFEKVLYANIIHDLGWLLTEIRPTVLTLRIPDRGFKTC